MVYQASRGQLDDDEQEHRSEEGIVRLKEITGPYVPGMVAQESGP